MTASRTRRRTARSLVATVAVASTLLLASCGSSSDDKADTTTTAPSGSTTTGDAGTTTTSGGDAPVAGTTVSIKGFKFNPPDLSVKVGDTVTWTNDDKPSHTATADDGTFDTKSLKTDKTGTFEFTKAGTFKYHCDIHPTMKGSIVVQ